MCFPHVVTDMDLYLPADLAFAHPPCIMIALQDRRERVSRDPGQTSVTARPAYQEDDFRS